MEWSWSEALYNGTPAVITAVAFLFWNRIQKLLNALKELGDVINAIVLALEDKKVTPEEIENIKVQIREALAAFKAIIK